MSDWLIRRIKNTGNFLATQTVRLSREIREREPKDLIPIGVEGFKELKQNPSAFFSRILNPEQEQIKEDYFARISGALPAEENSSFFQWKEGLEKLASLRKFVQRRNLEERYKKELFTQINQELDKIAEYSEKQAAVNFSYKVLHPYALLLQDKYEQAFDFVSSELQNSNQQLEDHQITALEKLGLKIL